MLLIHVLLCLPKFTTGFSVTFVEYEQKAGSYVISAGH